MLKMPIEISSKETSIDFQSDWNQIETESKMEHSWKIEDQLLIEFQL